ncbi:hypothetical protein F2Q69_00041806 [Brassica cretica]|uniref:Uncharacterized protein n=1 Tax=Brassica cretica TaxID=69181 RepID=A0A8S9NEC1_BRACR|nr:hypothetical protein F2Q69_00041806 [Brassica cretica]
MKLDGIYYPLNDSISWLTTCMEEMKQDIARIQNATDVARPSSIDRRQPPSIDIRPPPSIDIHNHTPIDSDTNRSRLVPKMTSDMSNTHYQGEEISADTYAALTRHQFNLESLGERLQRIENTTATMKDNWRRGDEAMRDFTGMRGGIQVVSGTSRPTADKKVRVTIAFSIDTAPESTTPFIDYLTSPPMGLGA